MKKIVPKLTAAILGCILSTTPCVCGSGTSQETVGLSSITFYTSTDTITLENQITRCLGNDSQLISKTTDLSVPSTATAREISAIIREIKRNANILAVQQLLAINGMQIDRPKIDKAISNMVKSLKMLPQSEQFNTVLEILKNRIGKPTNPGDKFSDGIIINATTNGYYEGAIFYGIPPTPNQNHYIKTVYVLLRPTVGGETQWVILPI